MLKIGHRGAKGYTPENTLISFEKAIEMQAHGIELDVHLSNDAKLMVIHDETIDRTTNGKGFVNQMSCSELQKFKIEDQQYIPTLEEVLNLVNRRCWVNIELKSYETIPKVIEIIEKYIHNKNWTYTDFIVSSFDWNALKELKSRNPKIPIGVLTEEDWEEAIAFAKGIQAKSIHPDYKLLNAENTQILQQNGFEVFPWTVNEKTDITKMKSFNVNGIISDFPDRI
ncbi:glycerophosphodiester phosphodiesterase [Flavobacterium sp. MAHUQ-51]|uniref:glycerophosphodiester phosphodiesterase n=1 Tax=Flavobacterium sp. GCM10022190 TaxID=3252639 RepID=UPI003619B428